MARSNFWANGGLRMTSTDHEDADLKGGVLVPTMITLFYVGDVRIVEGSFVGGFHRRG
jgi:hypothetical protein